MIKQRRKNHSADNSNGHTQKLILEQIFFVQSLKIHKSDYGSTSAICF
jgi:hypothetical protein